MGQVWSVSRAGGAPELVQKGWVGAATLSPDGQTLATWRTERSAVTFSVWLASPAKRRAPRVHARALQSQGLAYAELSPVLPGRQAVAVWLTGTDGGGSPFGCCRFQTGGSQPHRFFPRIPESGRSSSRRNSSWMPDSQRAVMVFPTDAGAEGRPLDDGRSDGGSHTDLSGTDGTEQSERVTRRIGRSRSPQVVPTMTWSTCR